MFSIISLDFLDFHSPSIPRNYSASVHRVDAEPVPDESMQDNLPELEFDDSDVQGAESFVFPLRTRNRTTESVDGGVDEYNAARGIPVEQQR